MHFSNFPDDILEQILAFATLSDLTLRCRPLTRRMHEKASAELERRLGGAKKCVLFPTKITRVELAMPSVVKAITFDVVTHRLYVCTLGDTPNECVLYEHLPVEIHQSQSWVFTDKHKGRQMQRIALPTESIDDAQFEGPFLVCRSRNNVSVIFDCRNRVLVELPMGYTNLMSSPSGQRMAALRDGITVIFVSPLLVDEHGECNGSALSSRASTTSYDAYRSLATLSSPASPTRSEDPQFDDEPVTLIPAFDTPFEDVSKTVVTDLFIASLVREVSQWTVRWISIAIPDQLVKNVCLPESIQQIGAFQSVRDDKCIVSEAHLQQLAYIDLNRASVKIVNLTTIPQLRCISTLTMCAQGTSDLPDAVLCCIGIVGNRRTIHMLSGDGTLRRQVDAPHTSLIACHPTEPILVSTNDEESMPDHLLLQALEGGYGSLIQFDSKSPSLSWTHISKTFQSGGPILPHQDRLSVVLIFCYAAISLALVWTTFALVYNGWWLYMQRLVFLN